MSKSATIIDDMLGRIPNVHPGEILLEEFLRPLGITRHRLAQDTGLTQTTVSEIIRGKRGITAQTSLTLGRYFGTSAEMWMNLQQRYELEEAQRDVELRDRLNAIARRQVEDLMVLVNGIDRDRHHFLDTSPGSAITNLPVRQKSVRSPSGGDLSMAA